MAKAQNPQADYVFRAQVSDIKSVPIKDEQDLAAQLFSKDSIKKQIDSFEKQIMGVKHVIPDIPRKTKMRVLEPEVPMDSVLIEELLNNHEKFEILEMEKHFTRTGKLRILFTYNELYPEVKKEEPSEPINT